MSNTPFDSFSKKLLEELLTPFGEILINREVLGESQYVDAYFTPSAESTANPEILGILADLITTPCLIEPYRNPVTADDIRSCLQKLFALQADNLRRSKREQQPRSQIQTPSTLDFNPIHV